METQVLRNIKAIREFMGLTRADFAKAIGVSASLITLVESAKREPTADLVAKVCRAFHVSPLTIYHMDMRSHLAEAAGRGTKGAQNG